MQTTGGGRRGELESLREGAGRAGEEQLADGRGKSEEDSVGNNKTRRWRTLAVFRDNRPQLLPD